MTQFQKVLAAIAAVAAIALVVIAVAEVWGAQQSASVTQQQRDDAAKKKADCVKSPEGYDFNPPGYCP